MRHKKVEKREIAPDSIFNNLLVAKLINKIMRDGKRSTAQHQVYGAMDIIKEKNQDPISIFEKAIVNVGPRMEVKPRRVGGAAYQIPIEVKPERKTALALRWIIDAARKRSNSQYHTFADKLAAELLDASQNAGEAVRKRDIVHRMAEANRAFAHFRW